MEETKKSRKSWVRNVPVKLKNSCRRLAEMHDWRMFDLHSGNKDVKVSCVCRGNATFFCWFGKGKSEQGLFTKATMWMGDNFSVAQIMSEQDFVDLLRRIEVVFANTKYEG